VNNASILKTWKFTALTDSKETIERRINILDHHLINLKED
jgi:hypothetical protein